MERFSASGRQLPGTERELFRELNALETAIDADALIDNNRCLFLADVCDLLEQGLADFQELQGLSSGELAAVLRSRQLVEELKYCLPEDGDYETRVRAFALLEGELTYVLEHASHLPPYMQSVKDLPGKELQSFYNESFPGTWQELEEQISSLKACLHLTDVQSARLAFLETSKAMLTRAGHAGTDNATLLLFALGCQEEFEDFRQLATLSSRMEVRTLISAVIHDALAESDDDDDDGGDVLLGAPHDGPSRDGCRPSAPAMAL